MGKILCHKTDLKNWNYITNNAFWHPSPPSIFRGWLAKNGHFDFNFDFISVMSIKGGPKNAKQPIFV